jgi:hypothetical protein
MVATFTFVAVSIAFQMDEDVKSFKKVILIDLTSARCCPDINHVSFA